MNFISEDQLNQYLFNELDFLFVLTMDGDIIHVNLAVDSILGYKKETIEGSNFVAVYPSEYKDKLSLMLPLAAKGDVTSCPYPILSSGGKVMPVDMKFYMGWWAGENVLVAVGLNLSAECFSKEVFFNMFNSSELIMVLSSIDTNVIYNVNSTFVKTVGYTIDEISGRTIGELGLFVNSEHLKKILFKFNKRGRAKGEAIILAKSGNQVICLFSLERIAIRSEVYLFVMATDITQRKHIEEKLRHLNFQQKLLADVAQLLNKQGNFGEIISMVLKLVGQHTNVSRVYIYQNTEDGRHTSNTYEWCNVGINSIMNNFQMCPVTVAPSWNKILNQHGRILSDSINELPSDIKVILEPLGVKSLLVYPLYIQNRLWGFMGFDDCINNKVWVEEDIHLLQTVTNNVANALERRKYVDQYKNSEMRLRLALNGAREGMWDWNLQTDQVFFTDTCFTMLGYQAEEMSGKSHRWQDLVHPDDWPGVQKAFANHLKGRSKYYECVSRVKDKSGEWRWILDHGKIVEKDAKGEALRAVGTHIDITKQKMAELQLQESLTTKDKLFSIISHDLRGPVGSFMQIIELLTSEIEIDQEMRTSLLGELKDMSKNTFYLLENLLNWSRSQRSEIEFAPRLILVNDLVIENVSLLSGAAKQKGIELRFAEEQHYSAYADYNMVNLVIRNLLSNAIKFTPQGGSIQVFLVQQDGFIKTTVKDSGVGMQREVVDKLFSKDHYHSTYGTNNEKGSGLGLMLCKDFVERNGGSIKIESEVGKGSSFIFTLPESE
ncbi:PAS domain S-box protein [uncultured Bacteroides sp.]|uniref:PAS domain S-box protein n=1 Tax=uncultured Bacteroides sp. TaxID=162156 RepID=UPI002AA90564|nr:PAS domain S-box protein [uncultured Bacteroides sp.]